MADGPLGRARQALLDAKEAQARKDTPANRERVELAMAHLDYLLDTPPLVSELLPPAPEAPGASHPGASVSSASLEGGQECQPGDSDSGAGK